MHSLAPVYLALLGLFVLVGGGLVSGMFVQRQDHRINMRGIWVLLLSGCWNILVTIFYFLILVFDTDFPCSYSIMGSYLMVALLHFPYIIRGVRLAIYSDNALRIKFGRMLKLNNCLGVILAYTLLSTLYAFLGVHLPMIHHTLGNSCYFHVYFDGIYMIITLMGFVAICMWCLTKIYQFNDIFRLSTEIKSVYIIWISLGLPFLVFQVFLRDRWAAAHFMVAMNALLLKVSFFDPLRRGRRLSQAQLVVVASPDSAVVAAAAATALLGPDDGDSQAAVAAAAAATAAPLPAAGQAAATNKQEGGPAGEGHGGSAGKCSAAPPAEPARLPRGGVRRLATAWGSHLFRRQQGLKLAHSYIGGNECSKNKQRKSLQHLTAEELGDLQLKKFVKKESHHGEGRGHQLLEDPGLKAAAQRFCQKALCEENLLFLLDVQAYKDIVPDSETGEGCVPGMVQTGSTIGTSSLLNKSHQPVTFKNASFDGSFNNEEPSDEDKSKHSMIEHQAKFPPTLPNHSPLLVMQSFTSKDDSIHKFQVTDNSTAVRPFRPHYLEALPEARGTKDSPCLPSIEQVLGQQDKPPSLCSSPALLPPIQKDTVPVLEQPALQSPVPFSLPWSGQEESQKSRDINTHIVNNHPDYQQGRLQMSRGKSSQQKYTTTDSPMAGDSSSSSFFGNTRKAPSQTPSRWKKNGILPKGSTNITFIAATRTSLQGPEKKRLSLIAVAPQGSGMAAAAGDAFVDPDWSTAPSNGSSSCQADQSVAKAAAAGVADAEAGAPPPHRRQKTAASADADAGALPRGHPSSTPSPAGGRSSERRRHTNARSRVWWAARSSRGGSGSSAAAWRSVSGGWRRPSSSSGREGSLASLRGALHRPGAEALKKVAAAASFVRNTPSSVPTTSGGPRYPQFQEVYRRYVSQNAPLEVNIPSSMQKKLERYFKDESSFGRLTDQEKISIYDDAFAEIEKMLFQNFVMGLH